MVNPYSPLYLTALTVIANILIHLWLIVPTSLHGKEIYMAISKNLLEDLMYQSEKPALQTTVNPTILNLLSEGKLTDRQLETISAVQTANQLLSSMQGKAKLSDVSDFMTNLAMQESRLGKDVSSVSYSPFQIDPIGYQDFVERADVNQPGEGGHARERVNFINEFLRNAGYGEDFDIAGFSFDKDTVDDELREPLIGALVTRMKLAPIKEYIPSDLEKQAVYWKKYWNTYAKNAKGKPEHFMNQVQFYNSILGKKTYDDTPLK